MINVVIPMAGLGSRFSKAGYLKPKPFIDVNGIPMISRVLDNLNYKDANYILIGQKKDLEREKDLVKAIKKNYNASFIEIEGLTEGTACTVLYARKYIDNDIPLLIANSDQIINSNIGDFIKDNFQRNLNGSILCFEDPEMNPKWSFAKINKSGLVTEVKEKKAISKYATVGIYLFSKGRDFVDGAIDMIIRNERVNNEFYTCPVYNNLLKNQSKIGIYLIDQKNMHGIGTPEDLNLYLETIK